MSKKLSGAVRLYLKKIIDDEEITIKDVPKKYRKDVAIEMVKRGAMTREEYKEVIGEDYSEDIS